MEWTRSAHPPRFSRATRGHCILTGRPQSGFHRGRTRLPNAFPFDNQTIGYALGKLTESGKSQWPWSVSWQATFRQLELWKV